MFFPRSWIQTELMLPKRMHFIAFAQDFNDDDNTYLKKEELEAAAEGWNAKSEELEEVQDDEEVGDDSVTEDEIEEIDEKQMISRDDEVEDEEEEPMVEETDDVESDVDDEIEDIEETSTKLSDVEESTKIVIPWTKG